MKHYDHVNRGRFPCGQLAGVPLSSTKNPDMIICPGCEEWYRANRNSVAIRARYAATMKKFLKLVYGDKALDHHGFNTEVMDKALISPEVMDKALKRAIEIIGELRPE